MYYVYRYTDLSDGIIKYVGIVYGQKREIKHRVIEHMIDEWCRCKKYKGYKIEYFLKGLNSRTGGGFQYEKANNKKWLTVGISTDRNRW